MDTVAEAILEDLFGNQRGFLPGLRCERADVEEHFEQPIIVGGLTAEEEWLMLSTLPKGARRLWLEPLDKGLSGSKVFSARYDTGAGRRSKPFVMKVGPIDKIDREAAAIAELASPYLRGIELPVYRRGVHLGLVGQEFRTLAAASELSSLRNEVRVSARGPQLVQRTLSDRLAPWYLPPEGADVTDFVLGALFEPYLRKGPDNSAAGIFPPPWDQLHEWVNDATGCSWDQVSDTVESLKTEQRSLPSTIVHGDLHSQNVLVDNAGECWPIDFAWTRDQSSPLVDLTMLECSLKFLAIPMRSDLRALLPVEVAIARDPVPAIAVDRIPYAEELNNVMAAVAQVRRFAMDELGASFADYRDGLTLMTYSLTTHPGLNTPYLLASLQILSTEASSDG